MSIGERVGSGRAAREDYALRQAPPTWRYRASALIFSLLGGATAGFFLAFPAELGASFGIINVFIGMGYALVIQTALNYVFVRAGARTGLNSDLMSRGLGLGFDGAAWTTLIYWVTWVIYFGIEGQIVGGALSAQVGIPTWASYLVVGAAFIPLVLYGVGFMARFQSWTLILYVIAMIALIVKVATGSNVHNVSTVYDAHRGSVTALGLLGTLAAYNGLIGNVTFGHTDIGRLVATDESLARRSRFGVLGISLIPYSIFAYVVFGLLGLFFWGATNGNTDPGKYFVTILGVSGFLLIVLTQLRINLINAYSGSLSLANFFSRLHFTPGRSVWALVMVVIGTAMMYGNVLGNLGPVLTYEGVFLAAWIGVIFADLVIVRGRLRYGPREGRWIEYRRAMLPHWNWTGVIPLAIATAIGLLLAVGSKAGLFGVIALDVSSWVAFVVALALTVALGIRSAGGSYQRRPIIPWRRSDTVIECPLDHEIVNTSDLFPCPYHKAWICSHDCMGTGTCGEMCTRMTDEELLDTAPVPPPTARLEAVNQRLARSPRRRAAGERQPVGQV